MVKTANKSLRESNNLLEKMVKESRNVMSPISTHNNKKGTYRTAHSSALARSYQFIGGKKEVLSRLHTSLNQSLAPTGPANTVSPSTTNVKTELDDNKRNHYQKYKRSSQETINSSQSPPQLSKQLTRIRTKTVHVVNPASKMSDISTIQKQNTFLKKLHTKQFSN